MIKLDELRCCDCGRVVKNMDSECIIHVLDSYNIEVICKPCIDLWFVRCGGCDTYIERKKVHKGRDDILCGECYKQELYGD